LTSGAALIITLGAIGLGFSCLAMSQSGLVNLGEYDEDSRDFVQCVQQIAMIIGLAE
jgi:hypothetical protein